MVCLVNLFLGCDFEAIVLLFSDLDQYGRSHTSDIYCPDDTSNYKHDFLKGIYNSISKYLHTLKVV